MSDLVRQLIAENKRTRDPFLDLSNCGLTSLPEEIVELVWLVRLNLGASYSHVISGVKKSTKNTGSYNRISSNSLELLSHLVQLQDLYLIYNQISDIGFLENLTQLQTLDLSFNQISDIGFLKNLTQLQTLGLSYNQVSEFSGQLLQAYPLLRMLYLDGNPISAIPKEYFEGDYKNALPELRSYFASLGQGSRQNDEVKLIVVGNTTAGKTSLMRFVREGRYETFENSTHGIVLTRWPVPAKNLTVNIWDFGGQEYYHATHRLFLDDHAVYVVVWEASTNKEQIVSTDICLSGKRYKLPLEHFSYNYWLDSVRYYAANSPVLLVQNKTDKTGIQPVPDDCYKPTYSVHPPAYHLSVDQANAYRGIPSNPNWTTFLDFKANLITALQANAATYKLGNGWVAIRDAIRQVSETRRWMIYADFEAFCQQAVAMATPPLQFDSAVEMPGLIAYLRGAASTIVYYADDKLLQDIVFLNPQWVTDTIYNILSYDIRDREENKGEFTRAEVKAVLDEKSIGDLTDTFLDLMKKDRFELIFDKPNCPNEYIVPQYLPDTFRGDIKALKQLRPESQISFTLHYPRFMPKSVFMRFMVHYGDLVNNVYWKYGIVLGESSQRAIAECQFSERKISVQLADGAEAKNRARDYFETLWKLSAEKPEVEVSMNGTDFVSIGDLKDSLNQVPKVKSKQGNWVAIEEFYYLFGKDSITDRQQLPTNMLGQTKPEIFFSYVWGDEHVVGESRETIVNELYESLKEEGYRVVRDKMDLEYKGFISEFMQRIGNGSIIIVAISDKYPTSSYCMFELYEAFRNSKLDKKLLMERVFPIRVEAIDLSQTKKGRGKYLDIWKEIEKERKKYYRDNHRTMRVEEHAENIRKADTYRHVGELLGILNDMNTLTKEILSKDNFAEMKKAIKGRIESLKA